MATPTTDMNGIWRHFKGGYYRVHNDAIFEGTFEGESQLDVEGESCVIYQECDNTGCVFGPAYVRPKSSWFQMVRNERSKVQRFVWVGESLLSGDEAK